MAIPKRLIDDYRLGKDGKDPSHMIFEKTTAWEGVRVGHYRVLPGHMPERSHKTHHIFVPLSGSVTIEGRMENSAFVTRRRGVGDVSITPAGMSYSATWEEELDYINIYLTPEFVVNSTVDFEANRNAKIVLSCGPQDALIRSISQALVDDLDSGQPAGMLYAESLVNTLAVHLLRHYSTESVVEDLHFGGLPAHKLRRVMEFIDEKLGCELTLTEIAEAADLSPYHFARSFKQSTGQTPIQFLMQRRIEYAKRMLVESELPIVEIGLSTGFKNQSHFTTLFRKLTAMTPKAFRNARVK